MLNLAGGSKQKWHNAHRGRTDGIGYSRAATGMGGA
jgi:hypothetical protein